MNPGSGKVCTGGWSPVRCAILILFLCGTLSSGLGAESIAQPEDLPVMGDEPTTFDRFYSHATSKNPDLDEYYARRLFGSYETECTAEGVSPVVALSQMIHETDYLLFTGAVGPTQYNYAGLGSTSEGIAGLNFGTMDRIRDGGPPGGRTGGPALSLRCPGLRSDRNGTGRQMGG